MCVCVHVTYAARMYRTYIREVPTSMFPPQRTHARSRIVTSTWDRREMRKPPPHRHHHLHLHHHHHRRRQSSPCMRGFFSPSVGLGQQPRADDDDDAVHRRDSAGSTCVSHLCPLSLPLSLSLSPSPSLPLDFSVSLSVSLLIDATSRRKVIGESRH